MLCDNPGISDKQLENVLASMPLEVLSKLDRMGDLGKKINASTDALDFDDDVLDEQLDEHGKIQAEMVAAFLPLVEKLVSAGLLTVHIDLAGVKNITQYSTICGDPKYVYDNGNIWIEGEYSGGNLRNRKNAAGKAK